MSSPLLETVMITSPSQLEPGLNQQRRTLRRISRALMRVTFSPFFFFFSFFLFSESRHLFIAPLDQLVKHGLCALRDTLQGDLDLNVKNCSIGIVGEGHPFKIVEGEELQKYLDLLEGVTRRTGPEPQPEPQSQAEPEQPPVSVEDPEVSENVMQTE
jgi:hypothetical protein